MSLSIILGPMFSGKSTELIRKIRLAKTINKKVLVIKPKIDNRYDDNKVVSHSFESEICQTVDNLESLDLIIINYDLIVIDEGQFFSDLKQYVLKWLDINHKDIIIGGLDGDFERKPIGQILELIPYSDKCVKINSLCKMCNNGNEGIFTHRISKQLINQIAIGGSESYMPLCRKHFLESN
jgi:thymidine kinase